MIVFSATLALTALLILAISRDSPAKVTGPCANCHTMHNSQNGSIVTSGGPYKPLLVNDCLGCHTGTNDGTNTTPYVYSTTEPAFGVNTLAGGNFYWVKTDDTKGHNVFADNPDDALEGNVPGWPDFSCASGGKLSCHQTISQTSSHGGIARQGCTRCHMVTYYERPIGFHHLDDGTGTKYVDSADKGWYRFLKGHAGAGINTGVKGIEHEKWNYGATASSHNEYAGQVSGNENYGFQLGNTVTAFCTGCHKNFHVSFGTKRHPSDAVIPNSGEYASISTTYDPNVPVARPPGFNMEGGPSPTVAAGTDMVMCLSCHAAHGSPYPDMLRWEYSDMIAGDPTKSGGCLTCHTQKNQAP